MAILSFLLFACNEKKANEKSTSIEIANDSVLNWIDMGKDPELPLEMKVLLLHKALSVADKRNNDSLKRHYFTELSWAYRGLRDSLMFRNANKLVNLLSRQANDTLSEAGSHWDLGSFLRRNSVQDSAYYHYSEAQKKFNTLGENFLSGRMHYNMALVQTEVKDYTGAEISAFKAIGLLKPLEKNLHIYRCYNILGSISKELKEYDRALEYLNQAREYLFKIDNITTRDTYYAFLLNNIGNVYKDQGDYSNATNYYNNALENNDSLQQKNPIIYAQILTNLSISRFKAGDTLNVFRDLTTGKQIKFEEGDMAGLSLSHYAFAEYYLSQNDTTKAMENAKLSKQFAQESTNNKRLLASLGLLAQIDTKNSLSYTQSYISLNENLVLEERKERNKFTRIRFETDEFIAENEILTRKKQIWTGIALIVFTLGLAVYIIINQRAKNQALLFQQQQQASNQEIFDLMLSQKQKIEETKKMEQKRISEELHDGVLGKMLGARMVLTGLNKRNNEEAVEERAIAISALKDVEGEVRAISHELSHAAYQNINNFITSLKDLLQSVGNANGIEHAFDYDDSFDWDSMKGDMKINLYRIIQETLQNAVKHSECKKILVNFVRANNLLNVTIADDGKGFKSKSGKKGIGMRNIESRVGKLNGTWDLNSVVDKGTTITFNIPLKDNVEHPRITVEEQVLK